MKRQALATAVPEFVILFRVDVRVPMLAAQDSTGVAKPFEELIAIFVSGMCQQFQITLGCLFSSPAIVLAMSSFVGWSINTRLCSRAS